MLQRFVLISIEHIWKRSSLILPKNNKHVVNLRRNYAFIFVVIHVKPKNKCCLPLTLACWISQLFFCYSKGNSEVLLLKVHRFCISPEGPLLNGCPWIGQWFIEKIHSSSDKQKKLWARHMYIPYPRKLISPAFMHLTNLLILLKL